MTEIEAMLIEHQCARLVASLANALDSHDIDTILSHWADDGSWQSPSGVARGKDAICALFAAVPKTLGRHLMSNVVIAVHDTEHASGTARLTYYKGLDAQGQAPAGMAGALLIADHEDRFIRTAAGWRFHYRDTRYVLRLAGA